MAGIKVGPKSWGSSKIEINRDMSGNLDAGTAFILAREKFKVGPDAQKIINEYGGMYPDTMQSSYYWPWIEAEYIPLLKYPSSVFCVTQLYWDKEWLGGVRES